MPSRQIKAKTSQMLSASMLSPAEPSPGPRMPSADSDVKSNKMKN